MLPCVIFEDDDLLVVNKPAGINTHAPAPFAGEGLHEWLRRREPRWESLAIVHRLDKETSGVMVFGKTVRANQSLTAQFTERAVRKKYLLLSNRAPGRGDFIIKSRLVRAGERYAGGATGELAETRFVVLGTRGRQRLGQRRSEPPCLGSCEIEVEPRTGRTHQIRVHAAENGFPILGDTLYGGAPFQRVCLHASELALRHPVSGKEMTFKAPADFLADARLALRLALIDPGETDAFRLIHGAADGAPEWYVERFGDFLLSQGASDLTEAQRARLMGLTEALSARGVYHKTLTRHVRRTNPAGASPQFAFGKPAPGQFVVRENGLRFALSFEEGYSVGLFLDQRDNRRRFLTRHVAPGFSPGEAAGEHSKEPWRVLNVFAYTCGFSVCAAAAGAKVTSLDLSKKYLDWGRRNFLLNGIDPRAHDFIYGDAFDWLRRLARKNRVFGTIALDPPTFSQSKEHGVFRVGKDCEKLVRAALPLLAPGGALFASVNAGGWGAEAFLESVGAGVKNVGRKILRQEYFPQPPDFPVSREEPAYLKTVWMRIA